MPFTRLLRSLQSTAGVAVGWRYEKDENRDSKGWKPHDNKRWGCMGCRTESRGSNYGNPSVARICIWSGDLVAHFPLLVTIYRTSRGNFFRLEWSMLIFSIFVINMRNNSPPTPFSALHRVYWILQGGYTMAFRCGAFWINYYTRYRHGNSGDAPQYRCLAE